ncbi:hypothetical protein L2E82_37761 [Cichorium intybus]|uniref:Uncharacterized protein n=1 Tax=Cichorium intybus TaxID=13427 RepID=A0ACB9AEU4_CICIN|nr:hypothetical protein L2E82_37761 [Cichorium intybus]
MANLDPDLCVCLYKSLDKWDIRLQPSIAAMNLLSRFEQRVEGVADFILKWVVDVFFIGTGMDTGMKKVHNIGEISLEFIGLKDCLEW